MTESTPPDAPMSRRGGSTAAKHHQTRGRLIVRGIVAVAALSLVAPVLPLIAVSFRATPAAATGPPAGQVGAGDGYSVTLKGDGTVWTSGSITTGSSIPTQVSGLTEVIAVAGGRYHALAAKADGTVWAWGNNHNGQLGNGTWSDSWAEIPVQVSGLTGVIAVAAGGAHSLALKGDGTVWAWGNNYSGELGDGTSTDRFVPVQTSGLTGVTALAAGYIHSLALKADGTMWAWGWGQYGQLGNGTGNENHVPGQVVGLSGVTAIAGGFDHSLALKADGTMWAFGNNYEGELGNGTTNASSVPVQVTGLSGVTALAAGEFHSLAAKGDGTVWATGSNFDGELGNGTTTNSSVPVQVSGLTGVATLAGGRFHSLALKSDGTEWAWGRNDRGQLGDGTLTERHTPVAVWGLGGGVPATAALGGGINAAAPNVKCGVDNRTGHPVTTSSGNFWHTFNDLAVPGRGPALDLQRTYNSAVAATDSPSNPFGFGWSSSYTMSVVTDGSGAVTVTQETGSQVTFTPDGTGGYSAPSWVIATLVHNADATYTFTRGGREVFTFDPLGQLRSESDLNGYTTTLGYPAPTPGPTTFLAVNDISVAEGNSGTTPATFTVTRSGDTTGASTVKYSTTDGTAIGGTDYTAVSLSTLSFTAGQASKTVTVNVSGDTRPEADKTFNLVLSAPTAAVLSDTSGTATIADDDGSAYLAVNDVVVNEGNSGTTPAAFTITRSGNTTGASTVSYKTTPSTATAGTDYTSVPLTTVTFAAGETAKTVAVDVIGDSSVEPNETFNLVLSAPTKATLSDASGTATVVDDDGTAIAGPATFLTVADLSVDEGNAGTTPAIFTITRSGNTTGSSTVKYTTADGTAIAGSDYTAVALTTLSFAAGEISKTVTVNVTGDTRPEADETFNLVLSAPTGAVLSDASGAATVANDDGSAYLAVSDVVVNEGNSGTTPATFTITRSGNTTGSSTVKYTTSGGTATAGTDYTSLPLTAVTFAAGETTKTVTVDVKGDATPEANETFNLMLSAQVGATLSDASAKATIVNDEGSLSTVTDPAGRSLTITNGANSKIASVTDGAGRRVSYGYDGAGNLTSVTDVDGGTMAFTYDGNHRLLTMADPRGGVVTNHYDASGRVDSQSDELARATLFDYTSVPGSTKVTDPAGNAVLDTYSGGLLVSQTKGYGSAQAATWRRTYDPATLGCTSVTDPNGHTTTMTYDGAGNRVTSIDALGRRTTVAYNALNEPTTVTDAAGVATTFTYDPAGNLATTARPLVGTTQTQRSTYAYGDPAHPGDVTTVTDPDGQVWGIGWDANGNLVALTDPNAHNTTSTYDMVGRRTSTVSARGNRPGADPTRFTTIFGYDPDGLVTTVTDPLGHVTRRHYDANRNLDSTTDADNNVTTFDHDAANQLTATHRADGTTVANAYFADGTLHQQLDGANQPTTYAYDALGRVVSVSDPLGRQTTYGYDGAGNQITKADPGGNCGSSPVGCTTKGYDIADQLKTVTYSDGTTPNVTAINYDADGRRLDMADGTGTSHWAWDSLGRLTSSTSGAGLTVGYGYDLKGQTTSITYPGGASVARHFDPAGNLDYVLDWANNKTTFGYDEDNDLTTKDLPAATGVSATFAYDTASQMTTITDARAGSPFASFGYGRDSANQLTSVTSTGVPADNHTFAYTALNQLKSVDAATYGYDAADNLTQLTSGTNQAYDAANQLCWSGAPGGPCASPPTGAERFSFDARGNRTQDSGAAGVGTYGYDGASRLTSAARTGTTSYAYNGDGLRMAKTDQTTSATTTFAWDLSQSLPLALAETGPGGTTRYLYGPGGVPLEQQDPGGTLHYFHADQLGSIRVVTDSSGAVTDTFSYGPYGQRTGVTGTTRVPFGFAGEYTDAETGFVYLRTRYYDPATGQFLSRDPITTLTQEPYAYIRGNPLNLRDPSGLEAPCPDPAQYRPQGSDTCISSGSISPPGLTNQGNGSDIQDLPAPGNVNAGDPNTYPTGGIESRPVALCDPTYGFGLLIGVWGNIIELGRTVVSVVRALASGARGVVDPLSPPIFIPKNPYFPGPKPQVS